MTDKKPCNDIPCFEDDGTSTCSKCGRTSEEIKNWPTLSKEEKTEVVKKIKQKR